ncbi:MAG TPA: efflux RND transporter periplasmic adaptor subunit, partial [Urbifossiella sp.]|nr:efflux RND transporter periplasmic adaptor subunit [Urbifossiella sp.]
GDEVHEGDLLFEIDPRPYKAQLDQADSQVRLYQARVVEAQKNEARARTALKGGGGSQAEVDSAEASTKAAEAQVEAAKASVELYKLNLGFTKVTSPIDGQVSRYYYTPGNLVSQDSTLLTTVVSTDPVYAYFDMDERTVVRIRTAINQGKIKPRRTTTATAGLTGAVGLAAVMGAGGDLPVFMGLDPEDNYPYRGAINFVNNVVNPSTGTIAIRGVFPNPRPPNGRRLFSPGMFVRIRVPIGQPTPALLVVDRAIGSDQGLKYLYVVDANNKVQYRRVKTGALQDDGLRVIEDGIKADDWVVTGALQQLRPDMEATPEQGPMPIPGAPSPPAGAAAAQPTRTGGG